MYTYIFNWMSDIIDVVDIDKYMEMQQREIIERSIRKNGVGQITEIELPSGKPLYADILKCLTSKGYTVDYVTVWKLGMLTYKIIIKPF